MPLTGAYKCEKLFRKSAGLDVDKADIARYQDFINRKLLRPAAHGLSDGEGEQPYRDRAAWAPSQSPLNLRSMMVIRLPPSRPPG